MMNYKSKKEKQHLDGLERRLATNELCLYEEALRLDRKRKVTYIR